MAKQVAVAERYTMNFAFTYFLHTTERTLGHLVHFSTNEQFVFLVCKEYVNFWGVAGCFGV